MAINNSMEEFHIAALLWRGNKLIRIGINHERHNPSFARYYKNGYSCSCHAEMDALTMAKQGDLMEIIRFRNPDGEKVGLAKPCAHCMIRIKRIGVKVKYTTNEQTWETLSY